MQYFSQKTLLFLLCLSVTLSTFEGVDKLYGPVSLPDSSFQTAIKYSIEGLIPLEDSTFSISFTSSTKNSYVNFIKHGQPLFADIKVNSQTNKAEWTKSCGINNNEVLVLSNIKLTTTKRQIFGQRVGINGLTVGSEFSIPVYKDQHVDDCVQLNSDLVLITYSDLEVDGNWRWVSTSVTYNLQNGSFGTKQFMPDNKGTNLDYKNPHPCKLKGTNSNILLNLYGMDFSVPAYNGLFIKQFDSDTGIELSGINHQRIYDQVIRYDAYIMQSLDNGGFVISFYTSSNFQFSTFDASFTEVCNEVLKTGSYTNFYRTYIIVKGNIAYVSYQDASHTKINILEIDITTCQISKDDVLIHSGTGIVNHRMALSNNDQYSQVIAITVSENTTGSTLKNHYYEFFFEQKTPCDNSKCYGCYLSETNLCDVCSGTTEPNRAIRRRPDDNTCSCQDGYYDTTDIDCQQCDTNVCATCEERADKCIVCQHPDAQKTIPTCQCNTGYIEHPTSRVCEECDNKCVLSCTGTKENCDQCIDTYTKVGNQCLSCNIPCVNCSTDQDTCTSCNHGQYLQSNTCVVCPIEFDGCTDENTPLNCQSGIGRLGKDDKCKCGPGYFDKGTVDCGECLSPCNNCTGSATTCEDCEPRYYLDGTTCQSCQYPCDTCEDLTTCKTCSAPGNRLDQTSCDCSPGYYDNDSSCIQCPAKYETCSDGSTPITCKGENRQSPLQDCICQDGFFENSLNQCQQCNLSRCKTCTTDPDNCLEKCSEVCALCNPSNSNICQTCFLGQYVQDGICESCHPKCLSCENNSDQCTACSPSGLGRSQNTDNNCGCQDGYYENGNNIDCLKCSNDNCKTCKPNGECLECMNDNLSAPLCNPQISKKPGFFDKVIQDGNSEKIIQAQCSSKCEKCTTQMQSCTECSNGANRLGLPSCECKDGYHDNNGTQKNCVKCPQNCQKCLDEQYCSLCEEGFILDSFTWGCQCQQGYKLDSSNNCQKCYAYQGECFFQCPIHTSENEQSLVCESREITEQSIAQLVWICGIILLFSIFGSLITQGFAKNKLFSYAEQKQKKESQN